MIDEINKVDKLPSMNATPAPVSTLPAPQGHAAGGVIVIDVSDAPDKLNAIYREALRRGIPAAQVVKEMFNGACEKLAAAGGHHPPVEG